MTTEQMSVYTRAWLESGRYAEAEGMRVFTYEKGRDDEPRAVLLLHGFPTSCYDWQGVIGMLSPPYRCVTFDFIGFGLSDKPEAWSYSLFQQADVAQAIAEATGIREAHLVSHDMGTSVHTELLAREQEGRLPFRVLSSTFLNGSMLQEMATITPIQKLLGSNETLAQAIEICNNMGANYVDGLKAVMKKPECISNTDALVITELMTYNDGNRRIPAASLYMRERYIHRERWIGALRATTHPAQLVWADGDPVANVEMGRALRDLLPRAEYHELRGLGHFLLMEDAGAVADLIRAFVARIV
jgi:pimeloyl-ACP methyl ester carboxylesterase